MSKRPDMPPLSETEQRKKEALLRDMQDLCRGLRQRNLENAVCLAMEAARGEGELVEHFAELGRRFGTRTAKARAAHRKSYLEVIEGGRA